MSNQQFTGFVPPKTNYFRMPNEWINICADIKSLAELKVIQYVLRHTWGFKEYDGTFKSITTDEFMHGRKRADGTRMDKGTGLSNRSVIDGLRDACTHGFLKCDVDASDKARINKAYALNMVDVKDVHSENSYEDSSASYEDSSQPDVKNLHSYCEESSHRSEKDTKEKHLKKDTKERERVASPEVAAPPPCASAHSRSSSSFSEKDSSFQIASPAMSTQPPPADSKLSAPSESPPARGNKAVAIGDSSAESKKTRHLYMKEARMYGVQALEATVDLMLRWDEINVVCGHPKWEWLALEKIVVLAHGTIEQMKRVREKLQAKGQKLTPETIWTHWWMLDSQPVAPAVKTGRQPRPNTPEVAAYLRGDFDKLDISRIGAL